MKALYNSPLHFMLNSYYEQDISEFLNATTNEIIGEISRSNHFDQTRLQGKAWEYQIKLLKECLKGLTGTVFFEFSIPRMGKRIDTVVITKNVVFVLEFKVGEMNHHRSDRDQVWDYALDLKNFHLPSHHVAVIPVLIATESKYSNMEINMADDHLSAPILANRHTIKEVFNRPLKNLNSSISINGSQFSKGEYQPTPTIIEAAISLYNSHTVEEITRSDAAAESLNETSQEVLNLIEHAKTNKRKIICFVTGVPGAGKTLVGLKVATSQLEKSANSNSVYLSGNGPLVSVLQEALARDKVRKEKAKGNKITKSTVKSSVKAFLQNIHHYRDAYLSDSRAPYDHVAIFDEAQRAWNKEQTVKFMKQRKGEMDFDSSEPEFLISCLDRHKDWAVIICLVGNGQEINTGEAGISEWLSSINRKFTNWQVYISPSLISQNQIPSELIEEIETKTEITYSNNLHLAVSMRSFRAEFLADLISSILERDIENSRSLLAKLKDQYPIHITRNLADAKHWIKSKARGSERYGMVVSSQAYRLKPHAIDVKSPINPIHWFLNDKDDVRSSYYLEDVATEFQIQGLELDWTCLVWDADLRYSSEGWQTYSFKGSKWQNIHKEERKKYLINAYRVLLTRARKGMVIVVPSGNREDMTRNSDFYDPTFNYLQSIGFKTI